MWVKRLSLWIYGLLNFGLATFLLILSGIAMVVGFTSGDIRALGIFVIIFLLCFFPLFEGTFVLYGLISYDFATRIRRTLPDAINDIEEILREYSLTYKISKFPRSAIIKTQFGRILLVGVFIGERFGERTAIFIKPKSMLDQYEEIENYVTIFYDT